MRKRSIGLFFGILTVFLMSCAAPLYPQGTDLGTIRGTVTDASGAVVPNANVEVIDTATNLIRKLTTTADGSYEAPNLRSGTYKVTVTMPGFNIAEILDVVLRAGNAVRADAVLQPKGTTETVTITAEAPLITTETPTVSATLDNQMLLELPRDSRDIYSYLYLNPNITQADSDGAFKFIGAQSYGASFSLDGQRSNGGVFGQPTASQPSLETIGELVVLSNNFTAEYAGIANVRVTTKRGAADYHGSAFYNNKNSALAAWNLNDKIGQNAFLPTPAQNKYPYPYFNLNELGGSFGGPLPKLKNTFFFVAYEHRWFHSPVNISSQTLEHPTLLAGDFSLLRDANKPAVPAAVTLTAAEVAQNTVGGLGQRFISIPSRLLNPATTALIKNYFPQVSPASPINATNGRLVDYFNSLPGVLGRNLGTLRIDHDFSDRDKFYGVYNAQNQTSATSSVVSPFVGLGLTQNERSNQTLSLSETHLWGGRVINEARGGFNRQPTFRRSNTTLRGFLSGIGFNQADIDAYGAVVTPSALDTYGHPAVQLGNFAMFSNGGRNTFRPLDQSLITFGDTLTWIKGRHTFKFGADLVRNAALDGFTSGRGNPRGRINYTGAAPDALARFLMGLPANTVQFVNKFRPAMDVYNWEQGYFAMDEFKVTPRLTLTLGVRYELITPFIENNDLLVNFDPKFVDPTTGRKGRFVIPSSRTLDALDPRYIRYGLVTADKIGVGRGLVNTDKNNFAPRLGAAWRLSDKTVLRGGYGFFYPTSAAQGIRDPLATNSFQVGLTKRTADPANPLLGWPGASHGFSPMTGGTVNALSQQISSNWVPFDLQSPRIEQYNFTFERETGWRSAIRLSYLGTRMHGLISGVDANLIPPSDTPFGTTTGDGVTACSPDDGDCAFSPADRARLPYPELSDYQTSFGNFGHGKSNAFQAEFNRRFAGGFTLNVNYTLLDQKTTAPDTGNASLGGTAYNQFSPDTDFGTDAFISHHRFITYGVWQLPVGHGKQYASQMPKLLDLIAGGWETTWQMFAKSGTGFTPYWWCENCGPVLPGNIASTSIDAVGGFSAPGPAFRPIVTGQGNVTKGDRIFNPDAFALMPLGSTLFSDSNVAKRNLLRGPGTWGVNFGVHKVFRAGERLRADLGADFNNLFNHPLKSPNSFDIGELGSFSVGVDPKTLKPTIESVSQNPNFGRLLQSYTQENVDSRRTVRLKLRLFF